ncbi:hypothetical protein GCM10009847_05310 [Leucobacter tardus]|uniref:Uncharacterized protein n=1 Tax=Leucobacter tardus TaxID=501483 RepID=A0A939QDA7_9MICO|nr:DUF6049 family protein [Leucobacter tardus]MBO2988735.1 hypothetical protein [Leucobacter tardus]
MPRSLLLRGTTVRDRVRASAAGALAVLLVASGWSAFPAAAETVDDAEQPIESEQSDPDLAPEPELVVAPAEPVFAAAAADFEFTVLIRNPGDEPLPAGQLDLALDDERATVPEDLDGAFPELAQSVASTEIGATDAEGEQSVTVTVPRDDFPLDIDSDAGVYRVQASITPAADDADDSADIVEPPEPALSSVVWRGPGSSAQATVSFIVPLVLTSETGAMPTRAQLSNAAARLSGLLDVAEAHHGTLAIDPRLVAGIRAYGDGAPAVASELLQRLETTSLDSFSLQFGDADPAAQAALGLDELLQPGDLSYVTRHGTFAEDAADVEADAAADAATTDAEDPEDTSADAAGADVDDGAQTDENSDTADAAGASGADSAGDADGSDAAADVPPNAPSQEELLAWDDTVATAWPAPGEVDRRTLDLVSSSGLERVIVNSANVEQTDGPRSRLSGMDAVITDARADEALARSIRDESPADRAAGLATAASVLAFSTSDDAPSIVIGLDRGAIGDAEDATSAIETLTGISWVNSAAVEDQPSGSSELRDGTTLEPRAELLQAALGREPEITRLSDLLVHPEYLPGYQRARLLPLFATRYATVNSDFDAVAERFQARDRELLRGVHVISSEHTQLLGASSRVPLQIHNSLPFDAEVTGAVTPASAAVSAPEREIEATLVPAEGNQTVLVPVRARVSSGESALMIELSDRAGSEVFYSGGQPLSIRAAVERIALITVGSLAALLLGFGIWRSVRRHGRGRTGTEDAAQGEGISRT